MRRVTRNAILVILAVLVLLLALGALPGLLGTGDPYRVTAVAVDAGNGSAGSGTTVGVGNDTARSGSASVGSGNATADADAAVNGTALSERQYPYTTTALREGRSDTYYKGYVGLKEAFTHSPFDEISALKGQNASAATDDGVLVRYNGTLYEASVTKE